MKSRLPARKERAQVARRMGRTLTEMAEETANADDVVIREASTAITGPIVAAGFGAVALWWGGAEMTLGHIIAIVAAAGALGYGYWRNRRKKR